MNIRSFIRLFSFEKTAAVQNQDPKPNAASAIASKGIASVTDSFENSAKASKNFFTGKQLDANSLQQEQNYSKPIIESGESFDAAKRYTGVRLQEGRVQLDSDFHESDDVKHEPSIALRDSAYHSFKDDDD